LAFADRIKKQLSNITEVNNQHKSAGVESNTLQTIAANIMSHPSSATLLFYKTMQQTLFSASTGSTYNKQIPHVTHNLASAISVLTSIWASCPLAISRSFHCSTSI